MTQSSSRKNSSAAKKPINQLFTLDSGKKIRTNDYIYFDQDRIDRAYQIGRVMGPVRSHNGRQTSDAPLSVEVEIFYRHHDLHPIIFPQSDHRRLYGSLRSVTVPIVNIKGICTVLHRHHIFNFEEYIQIDNCFYFDQVYYQQQARFYNAVPLGLIKNIQGRLLKTLSNQFHYLLCEPEVASSITEHEYSNSKNFKESSSSGSSEEDSTAVRIKTKNPKKRGRLSSEKSNSSSDENSDEDSEFECPPKNICDKVHLICTHNYPYRYYNPKTDINPEDPQAVVPPPGVGVGPQFQVSIPAYLGPHPKKKANIESRALNESNIEVTIKKEDSDSEYIIEKVDEIQNKTSSGTGSNTDASRIIENTSENKQPEEFKIPFGNEQTQLKNSSVEEKIDAEHDLKDTLNDNKVDSLNISSDNEQNALQKNMLVNIQSDDHKEKTENEGIVHSKETPNNHTDINKDNSKTSSQATDSLAKDPRNPEITHFSLGDNSIKVLNQETHSNQVDDVNNNSETYKETIASSSEDIAQKPHKAPPTSEAENKKIINGQETMNSALKKEDTVDPFDFTKLADPSNSLVLFHAPTAKLQRKAERILNELKKHLFCIPTFWSEFQIRAMQEMSRLDYNFKNIYSTLQSLSPIDYGVKIWNTEELAKFEDLLTIHGSDLHTIAVQFPDRSRADVIRQFFRWKGTMHKLASDDKEAFKHKPEELKSLALENTAAGAGLTSGPSVPLNSSSRMRRRTIFKANSTCVGCNKSGELTWHRLPSRPFEEQESTYCDSCASYFYRYAVHFQSKGIDGSKVYSPKKVSSVLSSPTSKKRGRRSKGDSISRAASIPPTVFESDLLKKVTKDSLPIISATSPPSTPFLGPRFDLPQAPIKSADAELDRKDARLDSIIETEMYVHYAGVSPNALDEIPPPSNDSDNKVERVTKHNRKGKKIVHIPEGNALSGPAIFEQMCVICRSYERSDYKISCAKCQLVVHKDCYLVEPPLNKHWFCDPCQNLEDQSHSKDLTCTICHVSGLTKLALKPTSKFNWAHLICAVFYKSLRIQPCSDDGHVGSISGISDLSLETWNKPCQCCNYIKGFKIKCEKCNHLVHASCAEISPAYQIGFDTDLNILVRCPAHPSTMPPLGAIDDSGQSLFVRHLSKRSLPLTPVRHKLIPRYPLRCTSCTTTISPMWWRGATPLSYPYEMPSILTPFLPSLESSGNSPSVWCHACRWKGPNQSSPPSLPTPALN